MRAFLICLGAGLLVIIGLAVYDQWPTVGPLLAYLLVGLVGLAVLACASVLWHTAHLFYSKAKRAQFLVYQQKDGQWPLLRFKRNGVDVLVNPNNAIAPGLAIGHEGITELWTAPHAVHLEQARHQASVRRVNAAYAGDDVLHRAANNFPIRQPVLREPAYSTGAPLINGELPTPKHQDALRPGVTPMGPVDALNQSRADAYVLGQSVTDGKLLTFRPNEHTNLGIFGTQGTGKSKSIGLAVAALSIRFGAHTVIFDPKGGADFGWTEPYAEWRPADTDSFEGQVASIQAENERRRQILARAGVNHWAKLDGSEGPDIYVLWEEFGTLRDELSFMAGGKAIVSRIDAMVAAWLGTCRYTGMHGIFIEHSPDKMGPVARGACKLRLTFNIDIAFAGILREPKAPDLAPYGECLAGGVKYRTWDFEPLIPRMQARLPEFKYEAITPVPDWARSTVPDATGWGDTGVPPHENVPDGTDEPGRWDAIVEAWFAVHPEALDGPARGISDLARAMCADNEHGSVENYEAYKGRAHPLFHAFRDSKV